VNLNGACPFWEKIKTALDNDGVIDFASLGRSDAGGSNISLAPYLVSNVNYFYPVQTEFSYTVNYKPDVVTTIFEQLRETKNTYHADAFHTKIVEAEGTEKMGITVEFGEGAEENFDQLDIESLKTNIRLNFIHSLLEKIAAPVYGPPELKEVPPPTDPHRVEFHEKWECTKSGFWGGLFGKKTKCYSRVYQVNVPVTGIGLSITDFTNRMKVQNTETLKILKIIIRQGSLTFTE
jgi:hypothetical protein